VNYNAEDHSVYGKTKFYSLLLTDSLHSGIIFFAASWSGLDYMSKANLTVFKTGVSQVVRIQTNEVNLAKKRTN
jgi:hypothetical protein